MEIRYEQAAALPSKILRCSADLFVMQMAKVFPEYQAQGPSWLLPDDDVVHNRLLGMAGVYQEQHNPARELLHAVKTLGSIRVTAIKTGE